MSRKDVTLINNVNFMIDGVVFTLYLTGVPEPDPKTGPVMKFFYLRSVDNNMYMYAV